VRPCRTRRAFLWLTSALICTASLSASHLRVGDLLQLGCRAAVKVSAAAQKGSSWLYSKGKELMNGGAASKQGGAPPRSQSRY